MKLKRFNSENINEEMYFTSDRKQTDDEKKFEIIERLSNHWTEKLKSDYLVPRSLYNYSLDELIKIEDYYLNENNDVVSFLLSQMNKDKKDYRGDIPTKYNNGSKWSDSSWIITEIIQFLSKSSSSYILKEKEFVNVYSYDELNNILKKEFPEEYDKAYLLFNESSENENNLIEESLKELQQLHSTNEAVENIRIEGNEIVFDCKCETDIQGTTEYNGIPLRFNKLCTINENVSFDDELSEKEIIAHARLIKEQCINEYLNEIKKKL